MRQVIIIGAGPSALFAAKTLLEDSVSLSVTIFEQGSPPDERVCPADTGHCQRCKVCAVLQGGGGRGYFPMASWCLT